MRLPLFIVAVMMLSSTVVLAQDSPFFSKEEIESGSYIDAKMQLRSELCKKGRCLDVNKLHKSGRGVDDMLSDFFSNENPPVRNLKELDSMGLDNVRLEQDIWSSSYWPLYLGGIAYRYAGGGPARSNFRSNYRNRIYPEPSSSQSSVDRMSPAAKYDLLLGDSNQGMTTYMWARGNYFQRGVGRVRAWVGYCHGWAAAAFEEDRPQKAVTVKGAKGENITFRPSDLQALASVLWANADFKMLYTGSRCNEREPRTDRLGRYARRIRSQRCFDINPGLWHTILLNTVGINKESFIFDASYDAEVWNHPIVGYSFHYYNISNYRDVENLEDAIVERGTFSDTYGAYRDERTKYIVGVKMKLTYKSVNSPSRAMEDDGSRDKEKTRSYRYDLELDANGTIIGGEWRQLSHPDMVWKPAKGTTALSAADKLLQGQTLDLSNGVYPNAEWMTEAKKNSRAGIPSGHVIRKLIELSRQ